MNDSDLSDFIDTSAQAQLLGISSRTLIRWRLARTGPPVYRLGSKVRYSRAATAQWLRAREQVMVAEGLS